MAKERYIRIRTERRATPDMRKLSKALLALAQAKAEQEAEQQQRAAEPNQSPENGEPSS